MGGKWESCAGGGVSRQLTCAERDPTRSKPKWTKLCFGWKEKKKRTSKTQVNPSKGESKIAREEG